MALDKCIGLEIHEKANGEAVEACLEQVFAKVGIPQAIIKDGGADLAKGVSLWREKVGKDKAWVVEDVGHVAANALKKQYESKKSYLKLLEITRGGAARLRQTSLAFQIPPKLRTKGRFQSISRLGDWALRMMEVLSVKGQVKSNSDLAKLRKALPGLCSLRPFIEGFSGTLKTVNEFLEVLKNYGLNRNSYLQGKVLLEKLPRTSLVRRRLLKWLKRHLWIHCRMGIGQIPLLVSSDIIESLFGKFKQMNERSAFADMNRSVLVLPMLCGQPDSTSFTTLLEQNPQKKLLEWDRVNVPYTLRRKRREFFEKNISTIRDQKPGKFIMNSG